MEKLLEKHEKKFQRMFEILPGTSAWLIILFPLWGAFFIPRIVAYFTIGFLVFWFYRSLQAAFLGLRGFSKIRRAEKINWHKEYQKNKTKDSLKWEEIRHMVIIPNYMESVLKISSNLDCLVQQKDLDPQQIFVVLAMEARAKGAKQRANELMKKYHGKFGKIMATYHPPGLPGEVVGKASNETWAAKKAKKLIVDQEGYDINKITLSSCDADACFHLRYFSALTYEFSLHSFRYLRFWQSPIFWHNNYWRVPAPIRIVGTMGNVIHIADLIQPDNLFFNYSCYSASLKMIDKAGYWDTDIIPEDWHIFLQCFFDNEGKVDVDPIFLPTSIDAPEGKNYFASLISRYEQCKRHAWGATDIPYAIKQAIKHPEIPLWHRFFRIFKLFETHMIWTTNWFILTLGAWIPALVNPVFKQTALGYNLPKISRLILTTCLLFLFIIIVLDMILRPKRPKDFPKWRSILEVFQWVLMPVATLFMSVLPGLDSQTRLMFGKRLEYRITEKID
ncbi:hypothetical protein ACFL0Y_02705 [Patescibacteria group bacterium]